MDYTIFDQMQEGVYSCGAEETEQAYMERILRQACMQTPEGMRQRINEMLCAEFCACDAAEQSLTLAFPALDWMRNPGETLHGGILTTAMDVTFGLLARFYKQTRKAATVQLSINFLRTVDIGESVRIRVKAEKVGSKVIFMSGKAIIAATQDAAADATAVFI